MGHNNPLDLAKGGATPMPRCLTTCNPSVYGKYVICSSVVRVLLNKEGERL